MNSGIIQRQFESLDRGKWIQAIVETHMEIKRGCSELHLSLGDDITFTPIEPLHIVTLSCLIDSAKVQNAKVWLVIKNEELNDFVLKDIRITSYWRKQDIPIFSAPEQKPYNLWRIDDKSYYNYMYALNLFFQNQYFQGKDLSGLNNCIAELYQNIFDHAEAHGTAFSYIEYKEIDQLINIAVCDFGKGIPTTLHDQYPEELSALENCLKTGISAGSRDHNKGYGMENIISSMTTKDEMRIISNHAMLYRHNDKNNLYELPYNFQGTLLYVTIHIDSFVEEEIMDTFTF